MSERSILSDKLIQHLNDAPDVWNAPWGVIDRMSTDKKFREITFGRAGILDATIRVYTPTYVTVKWRTAIRRTAAEGYEVFKGPAEWVYPTVVQFLKESFA
jgi:hypothetical protein